mgnify:CR=1 FL=1
MTVSVDRLYRQYLEKAGADPDQADYLALHQGPEGTRKRHAHTLAAIPLRDKKVLDIACGTALLLDNAARADELPHYYFGTDLLPEREEHVLARIAKHNLRGGFAATPVGTTLRYAVGAADVDEFDVALAIGLAGFEGFATEDEIGALIEEMRRHADKGGVTVPGFVPGRGMETDYCLCHDSRQLSYALRSLHLQCVDWGWDFLLHW